MTALDEYVLSITISSHHVGFDRIRPCTAKRAWWEVFGIGLEEINRMGRGFLIGIEFGLYVDKSTYES
jgi:hypothetical protein